MSKGIQAMLGYAGVLFGVLSDPNVFNLLPAKVAAAVTLVGGLVAMLSHPPTTPISGTPKV